MKASPFLIMFLIFPIFLSKNLTCGDEYIEHCEKWGTGENIDSCEECEEKYFPFLSNVLCLPCDHSIYGQFGCGGKCSKGDYENERMVFCEENGCKKGYYNIEGICLQCSMTSDHCIDCTFLPNPENEEQKDFKCLECESNQYKIMSNNGRCHHCHVGGCEICHFENDVDVCDNAMVAFI